MRRNESCKASRLRCIAKRRGRSYVFETLDPARTALVVSGDSYRAQHPTQKHFGLGMAKAVVALVARWPDGTVTRLDHPAINQYHELRPK